MAFKLLIRFYFWMENPAFVFCFGKHTKPKGIGIGCHVFLFYYFPHTFRSFQKFNAYFDLFLKQKFQDPSIAWSKMHTLRASGMKNIVSDRKVKISWKFTHIFSSKLVIFLSFFLRIVSTHTMFKPSIWFNSMNQHFWAQNIKLF